MSEWQPIETAPVGVPVRLGWWEDFGTVEAPKWTTRSGIAWEEVGWWFFRRIVRKDFPDRASYWMPLPPPPSREGGKQ